MTLHFYNKRLTHLKKMTVETNPDQKKVHNENGFA